ncbi:MAG: DUF1566 domain-containing protein [Paludibacter sp.]
MKKIFTILAVALFTASVFAQAPQKISYQAVIRNNSNALVTNTQVAMQISILQGSINGTAVYVETQTPTTNANGLVSIEIGGGTFVSGTTWDGANGPFYIKTETDLDGPTGGITYTITGTSQLLSVPYALYANTAGSATRTSEHYVGELYGGGVVFWVDQTGQHGLIVSMVDLSTNQVWSNVANTAVGTTNDWDGANNTTAIIGQSGHTSSAAKLCADYTNADYNTGPYSDWYLPSVAELNHICNNFYEVQKALTNDGNMSTTPLVRTYYWSSTERNETGAFRFILGFGYAHYDNKSDAAYASYVRAVRAF